MVTFMISVIEGKVLKAFGFGTAVMGLLSLSDVPARLFRVHIKLNEHEQLDTCITKKVNANGSDKTRISNCIIS